MAQLFNYMVTDLGRDEADKGIRYDVYKDSEGYLTVGRGHRVLPGDNLKLGDVVDPQREQRFFATDIRRNIEAARQTFSDFDKRPMEFQRGVTNFLYQLGENAFDEFPNAYAHFNAKVPDIKAGVREMLTVGNGDTSPSKWVTQTSNRARRTTDMILASMAPAPAASPAASSPVNAALAMPSDEPDSFLGRRADEVEMLAKSFGAGLLNTGALALQVIDGPLDATDGAADQLSQWAGQVNATIPQWLKDDIYKKTIISDGQGGWEFNVNSVDDMAGLLRKAGFYIAGSAGPGGAIAGLGKGIAVAGAKALPKFFAKRARLAPAMAYGTGNAGYIAADSYQNVYTTVYSGAKQQGLSDEEAIQRAEDAAQLAALTAGMIAMGTGTIGGLAMTGGGLMSRVGKGMALGAATEAVEEPGQYVAEQLAMGAPVDPLEVAERAVLGAFTAGPMEGAMAGIAGSNTEQAAVDIKVRAAGEALIDDVIEQGTEVPTPTPMVGDAQTVEYAPVAPVLPDTLPGTPAVDDIPVPAGPDQLDLRQDYFDELEGQGTTAAPGSQVVTSAVADVDMAGTPLPAPEPVPAPVPAPEPEIDQALADAEATTAGMKGPELNTMLKNRDLPVKGKVAERRARLTEAIAGETRGRAEREQAIAEAAGAAADKRAEAEALAQLDEDLYGDLTAEDKVDQADAAVEAYAAKMAEAEPEPAAEVTRAELDAEARKEADAEAGALVGKYLQAELESRGLVKGGKKLDKQKRVADALYVEKQAKLDTVAPAPLTASANEVAAAKVVQAKADKDAENAAAKLAKDQQTWDKQRDTLASKSMTDLRAVAKRIGLKEPARKKVDLLAQIMKMVPARPEAAPVVEAPVVEAPVVEAPVVGPEGEATTDAVPDPEPVTDPEVVMDDTGVVKPKTLKATVKRIGALTKKLWGESWGKGVYRVQVGNRVFTAWRGRSPLGLDGRPLRGAAQSYVYVEMEPEQFTPEDSDLRLGYTGAKNATDMKAAILSDAQGRQDAAEEQAAESFRRNQPASGNDNTLMTEARDQMLKAKAGLLSEQELIDAAISMVDSMRAADSDKAKVDILASFEKLEQVYNSKYSIDSPPLREVAAGQRGAEIQGNADAAARAATDAAGAAAEERRAKEVEDQRNLNTWEQAVLEAEQNRGLSMEAAGYWFRNQMRRFTRRGEPTPEDLDYKRQNPKQAEILETATISEVLSRALASQRHKWWVRLGDSRLALKERLNTLRTVVEKHNAGLDPVLDKDKFWEWTDEMDAYVMYDQQDAKVGSRIDDFNRIFLKPFAAALTKANITESEMNDYVVSVHALARNAHLKLVAARGGNEAPGQALSGVTDKQANDTLDRLAPGRDPDRLAQFEQLFEVHLMAVTAEQRGVYREHGLVPDKILASWEPAAKPADIYNLPVANDPKFAEKVEALYRYTYVPLQHSPIDVNYDMVVANLRKTDTPGIGDVYGDEVKAAMGAPQSDTLPQHVFAQMQRNVTNAYVRGAHNDTLRALADIAAKHPNRFLWHVIKGETAFKEDPLTGEIAELPLSDETTGYVMGQDVRTASGVSAFRDQEMTTIRFKLANGMPALIQVHDAMLATALAPETTLSSWPMRNLGKLSRWVSSINTTYSPGFMMVNPIRDYMSAKVQLSESGLEHLRRNVSLKNYKKVFKAYWAELRGEAHDGTDPVRNMIDRYRLAGGHTQFYRPETLADHVRSLESAMADVRSDGSTRSIKQMLVGARNVMRDTNTVIENIARILAFEAAVTIKDANGNLKTDQQAATISKNLVVNFGRRGTWGPALNALYPFYNASVQGNAILWQTWKRSPKVRRAVYGLAALGFTNGILQELISGDDDDGRSRYSNISDHVKERNLVFFIPGTEDVVKMPLPYGLNVPVVIGDSLASLFAGSADPKDHIRQLLRGLKAAKSSFNPIASSDTLRMVAPLIAEPAVDLLRNRNFFNSPINPDRSPYEKGKRSDAFNVADPDDSRWSTKIAQQVAYMTGGDVYDEGLIDIGPGTLRYMWDFALGSAGSTVRRTMEALTADTLHESGVKTPIIRRLYGTMSGFRHKERYYEMREELNLLKNERELFRANRRVDPKSFENFEREHGDYWSRGVMGAFDRTEKRLRSLIRGKNKIRDLKNKTPAQRKRIEAYNTAIDKAVTDFNSFYYNRFILGDR